MKTIKKTLAVGPVKLTIERPFTQEDAFGCFKAAVEKLGGSVQRGAGASYDEVLVQGISVDDAVKLSRKYAEDLGHAVSPLDEALRRYGKTIGLDPSFVDATVDGRRQGKTDRTESIVQAILGGNAIIASMPFERAPRASTLSEVAKAMAEGRPAAARATAAKKVADVAPHALSTWDFQSQYLQRLYGQKVCLVGQHYRGKLDQEVLGWKREGNMALLVAEPDNPVDMNAVMVLAWNDQTKHWHHVGYVRATEAALLRGKWTGDHKNAVVARFTSIPQGADGHRGGRNIELTLTGEVRTYPGYRL